MVFVYAVFIKMCISALLVHRSVQKRLFTSSALFVCVIEI